MARAASGLDTAGPASPASTPRSLSSAGRPNTNSKKAAGVIADSPPARAGGCDSVGSTRSRTRRSTLRADSGITATHATEVWVWAGLSSGGGFEDRERQAATHCETQRLVQPDGVDVVGGGVEKRNLAPR